VGFEQATHEVAYQLQGLDVVCAISRRIPNRRADLTSTFVISGVPYTPVEQLGEVDVHSLWRQL
jgi:hypothetical protein